MKYIKIIKYIGFYTKIHTGFTIKPVHQISKGKNLKITILGLVTIMFRYLRWYSSGLCSTKSLSEKWLPTVTFTIYKTGTDTLIL